MPASLTDRRPDPPAERLVTLLAPPPRFDDARFATYVPDPAHPSQAAARVRLEDLAGQLASPRPARLWRRRPAAPRSLYLDGGFGVGKTHLLAALWHAVPAPRVYASFAELVALVGRLSVTATIEALAGTRLLCVDEFELDDPANTRLVARILGALVADGACVAATSNTLPGSLGEGRFDAGRFRREIETLSAAFDVLTIEGEDYRRRGEAPAARPWTEQAVARTARARASSGRAVTLDGAAAVHEHLASMHPIRYRAMVHGLDGVFFVGLAQITDLATALRFAYLVDVLYDERVPAAWSGVGPDALFGDMFRSRAYRKVLGRCRSRLGELLREAGQPAPAAPAQGPPGGRCGVPR